MQFLKQSSLAVPLALGLGLSCGISPLAQAQEAAPCSLSEVVYASQGMRKDGGPVVASRSVIGNILGEPQKSDDINDPVNYFSMGFGGYVIAKFNAPVKADGTPAPDLQIFETSFGDPTCDAYPEKVRVFVRVDAPMNTDNPTTPAGMAGWTELTTAAMPLCEDGMLNLTVDGAKYIALVDVSTKTSAKFNGSADGFDLDGIICLNGAKTEEEGCFPTGIGMVSQGLNSLGNAPKASRSNPAAALTPEERLVPANAKGKIRNPEGTFFSLGFGGSIVLNFATPIANGAGDDLKVWEATWNPLCAKGLGEKAEVYAKADGINGGAYVLLGTICEDASLDLGVLPYADAIKIVDVSTAATDGQADDSPITDGFDVDGIECLNGTAIQLEPDGCFAYSVIEYLPGLNFLGNPVLSSRNDPSKALGVPQSVFNSTDPKGSFVSLGFDGRLLLMFEQPIANGPGDDVRVYEISFGNPTDGQYPEKVLVFAGCDPNALVQLDPMNVAPIANGVLDFTFDLGSLSSAQYIMLVDASNPDDFENVTPLNVQDGFDVDAVECLNGSTTECDRTQEAPCTPFFVASMRGSKEYAGPFRDNNETARGLVPQEATTGTNAAGTFYTLGFGGKYAFGFTSTLFDNAGADLLIYETSFGQPSCATYPERVMVYGRLDAPTDDADALDPTEYVLLEADFCGDQVGVDFDGKGPFRYFLLVDISSPAQFPDKAYSDGYDLDGVACAANQFGGTLQRTIEQQGRAIQPAQAYPNPTNDRLTVEFNVAREGNVRLSVVNMFGQRVFDRQFAGTVGQQTQVIDIASQKSGLYIVTVETATGTERVKVMKQ